MTRKAARMSNFAKKVKAWYDAGLWTLRMVGDALTKGRITQEEYDEIVGVQHEPEAGE